MTTPQTPSAPAEQLQNRSVALIRNWPLTLLSGPLLLLLLSLGVWQIQRGEEKALINAAIDQRLSAQPRTPAELENLQHYTPVRMLGHYTDEFLLLDNRTRNGRVGYEVLQVFVCTGQRWLINRGWLPAPLERDALPEVHWPRAAKVITGFLYPVVPADESRAATSGQRIQQLDSAITDTLNLQQSRWTIRLSADSDTALITDWQLINSPPQRHYAYAAQWFAMAAALLLLWLFAATGIPQLLHRKKQNNNDNER